MNGCIYRSADNICKFWSKDGIESYCDSYSCEKKTPSNADRIRAMSDEELATWIDRIQADAYERGMMETPIVDYPNIYSGWLNWLKEEAKDE